MEVLEKLFSIYTSTAEYVGVFSLSLTIILFFSGWINTGRKQKKSQRILNRLCKCSKKDSVNIVVPYHELKTTLYGARQYVLANEMDEIHRLYQLFWSTYGFQKICLDKYVDKSVLNILIGGPAMHPAVSRYFAKNIPDFQCVFYGNPNRNYNSSQFNENFFECDTTVCNGKIKEGFYFKSEQPFEKFLDVNLIDGKKKEFCTDYALFIRIEDSDINARRSNFIMFGQSSCGTQAAVDFFIKHYDILDKMVEEKGHKNENFMLCFDVVAINGTSQGIVKEDSLVDLSEYVIFK